MSTVGLGPVGSLSIILRIVSLTASERVIPSLLAHSLQRSFLRLESFSWKRAFSSEDSFEFVMGDHW